MTIHDETELEMCKQKFNRVKDLDICKYDKKCNMCSYLKTNKNLSEDDFCSFYIRYSEEANNRDKH